MLYSLDLETVCNVDGCKGFGGYKGCKHALSPWHDRITIIAVVRASDRRKFVFNDLEDFWRWYCNEPDKSTFIGHNFKFDLLHLWVHLGERGGKLNPSLDQWVGDSMLAAYVCTDKIPESWMENYNAEKKKHKGQRDAGIHSLKTTAPFFLGVEPFWEVENMEDPEYVTKDALYSLELMEHMEGRLKALGQWDFYSEQIMPWAKMLIKAEYTGIRIDMKALEEKEMELKARKEFVTQQLDELWSEAHEFYYKQLVKECWHKYEIMCLDAGHSWLLDTPRYLKLYEAAKAKLSTKINYDSPKQMTWLLRDYLGLDISSLEGNESTGIEVLERLKSEGRKDIELLIELRGIEKLLSSFIDGYREKQVNGVIHPSFNLAATKTGRLSGSSPNLQQVPQEIRPLFIPRDGHKFITYDYSGIEAVLIALYSEDPTLTEILVNNLSIHDYNAKVFFDLDCDVRDVKKLYPAERQTAKRIGFSGYYGAGAARFQIAFTQSGFPITEDQARHMHRKFKQAYSVAWQYGQRVVQTMETGEVLDNLLGRPLKVQDPADSYMTALNMLIQSSASDLTLNSAWNVTQGCQSATPLLFVHDSVTFEVPDSIVDSADKYIQDCFTSYPFKLKLKVEGGVTGRWEK